MKKTYAQLVKQIETLRAQAEQARRKELRDVIERVKGAIAFHGLTAADLGLAPAGAGASSARNSSAAAQRRRPGTIKYRDRAGHVWSGRGPRPRWLKEALAGGSKLEDFLA